MKCWGYNNHGQLGCGDTTQRTKPNPVSLASPSAIASGLYHVCALSGSPADVYCWGLNGNGQAGKPSGGDVTVPSLVGNGTAGASAIAAGEYHACAVVDGRVKCWGYNALGQLGNGLTGDSFRPVNVAIPGNYEVVAIAAGGSVTCAVANTQVYCWGDNGYGQLGVVPDYNAHSSPQLVPGLAGVTQVAVGLNHACAKTRAGEVRCWGNNSYGQLGNNSTVDSYASVQALPSGAVSIVAGKNHSCLATSSPQRILCWGRNNTGQLGTNDQDNKLTPTLISDYPLDYQPVMAGGAGFSCGLKGSSPSALLMCWGTNLHGELGKGDLIGTFAPANVQWN